MISLILLFGFLCRSSIFPNPSDSIVQQCASFTEQEKSSQKCTMLSPFSIGRVSQIMRRKRKNYFSQNISFKCEAQSGLNFFRDCCQHSLTTYEVCFHPLREERVPVAVLCFKLGIKVRLQFNLAGLTTSSNELIICAIISIFIKSVLFIKYLTNPWPASIVRSQTETSCV